MLTIWRSASRLEEGPRFLGSFTGFRQTWIKEEWCQECGKFGNKLLSPEEASQELSQSRESLPGLSPKRLETKRSKAVSVHHWNELAAWQDAQVRDGICTLLWSICSKLNIHSRVRTSCVLLQKELLSFTQRSALRMDAVKSPWCAQAGVFRRAVQANVMSLAPVISLLQDALLGDSRCFYLFCLLWNQGKYCVLVGDFCRQCFLLPLHLI